VLVPITVEEERRAIGAFAELLAPLFPEEPARDSEHGFVSN
jgi:hypothetical protein